MSIFYFHTDCETRFNDQEGLEIPTIDGARVEAARLAADMLREGAVRFWGTRPWTVTCTDNTGLIFFVLEVSGLNAAAGGGSAS